jgi:hypothetical protein
MPKLARNEIQNGSDNAPEPIFEGRHSIWRSDEGGLLEAEKVMERVARAGRARPSFRRWIIGRGWVCWPVDYLRHICEIVVRLWVFGS